MPPEQDLADFFERPATGAYFDCAHMGLAPRSVIDRAREGLAERCAPWRRSSASALRATLLSQVASLVGASAADLAIIPSASHGLGLSRRLATLSAGARVLLLEDEHPAAALPWRAECQLRGASIRTVAWRGVRNLTAAVLDALDADVRVVCLPQTHWIDGAVLDLAAIGVRCRANGTLFVVDATQTVGARPFDIAAVKPDLLTFSGYKWLFGPIGIAYLYVAPEHRSLEPAERSWTSDAGMDALMFDGEGRIMYPTAPLPTMGRFDASGTNNSLTLGMALSGVELVSRLAPQRIHAHILRNLRHLGEQLPSDALRWQGDRHFCAIEVADARAVAAELAARGILVSARAGMLRMSGNVWNDDADVAALGAALLRYVD